MDWPQAYTPPTLEANDLHVWRAHIVTMLDWAHRRERLHHDEIARRHRFSSEPARRAYAVSRSILRHLLGSYLGAEPLTVPIIFSPHGKPMLGTGLHCPTLEFNLTHSGEWALLAFAWGRRVGVDIEDTSRTVEFDALAERFFAPGECAALRSLPPELRRTGFYNAWTRKEAYIKGRSEGLSLALDAFEVSLAPDAPPALLHSAQFPKDPAIWTLWDIKPANGYAAALAIERRNGPEPALRLFHFTPE